MVMEEFDEADEAVRQLIVHVVRLDKLTSDPNNARLHDEKNLTAIRTSLSQFGQVEPLVVREGSGIVIGGNGRLEAMRDLGWQRASVSYVNLSDEQATALGIALNRTAELARWDNEKLEELLDSLSMSDEFGDMSNFGFSDGELEAMVADAEDNTPKVPVEIVQDEIPEPPEEPITKLGDIWVLGEHRVICGDSTERDHYPEAEILFTDPPYGVEYQSRVDESRSKNWGPIRNDELTGDDLSEFIIKSTPLKKFSYICAGWESISAFQNALGKPRSICVWDKLWFGLGKGYRRQFELVMFYGKINRTDLSDVWSFKRAQNYQHPTQKPVDLVAKALVDCAGESVYDPFGGSGTTLIAAEQVGISSVLVEIEPKYCDVIIQRWENLTGKKAKLQ